MDKLLEKLREPFAREELEFRVGAVNKDKMEGLALAYVQARAIQNRLDELFGMYHIGKYQQDLSVHYLLKSMIDG